ncbi:MAG: prephenate dehydratase [Crocinitomicaceae bacterium]|nr:prephenate dehydratase [Crocinitomicaceae bacterium]
MKRVAIKGIGGSFHDQVARSIFGEKYQAIYCTNFSEMVDKLVSNEVELGVMAIENSLVGTLLENYTLIRHQPIEIIGEKYLKVDHNLLALPGQKVENISIVISHEMALKQCKNFLDSAGIKSRQSFSDTASASAHIGQNMVKGVASIASTLAAKNYGLEVLASNVQDNPKNYTRFLVIRKTNTTGMKLHEDKATIIFSVENAPGRLALVLNYLENKGINLTKIESVPKLNNPGKFDMITDLELPMGENFQQILPELYQLVDEIKLLGVYEKSAEPWE